MILSHVKRLACDCSDPGYHRTGDARCGVSVLLEALRRYRAQHDEECRGGMCLCGWRKEAHEYRLKPALAVCIGYRPVAECTCGLDALLTQEPGT